MNINGYPQNKKRHKKLAKLESILYGRALIKVPVVYLISITLMTTLPFIIQGSGASSSIVFSTFLSVYLLGFMFVFIKNSFNSLLSASSISGLFISYFAFLFVLVLLFSNVYEVSESLGMGYLSYGQCSDDFDPSMIESDPMISREYFYYTGVTLFGVGYGDICPMGWNKSIALINSFVGNFLFTVVMVLVVTSFLKRIMMEKKPIIRGRDINDVHRRDHEETAKSLGFPIQEEPDQTQD